jgi:hypothetical protein
MPSRPAQRGAFLGWLVGVPGLAAGFYVNVMPLIAASAAALLVGVALSGVNGWVVASHAFWGRPSRAFTAATSDASSSSP